MTITEQFTQAVAFDLFRNEVIQARTVSLALLSHLEQAERMCGVVATARPHLENVQDAIAHTRALLAALDLDEHAAPCSADSLSAVIHPSHSLSESHD